MCVSSRAQHSLLFCQRAHTRMHKHTLAHTHAYCSLAQRAVLAWKAGPSYQNMIYHNKVIFNLMTRERTLLTLAHCLPAQKPLHCFIPSTQSCFKEPNYFSLSPLPLLLSNFNFAFLLFCSVFVPGKETCSGSLLLQKVSPLLVCNLVQ